MLTQKTLAILGKCVTMCHTMRVLPYQWNFKRHRLELSKASPVPFYFTISHIYFYAIFLVIRIPALKTMESTAKTSLILGHIMYLLYSILMCAMVAVTIILKEEVMSFVNHYIEVYLDFGERFGTRHKKGSEPTTHADIFLKLVVRALPFIGFMNILPYLRLHHLPFHYYSVIHPYLGKSYILILLLSIYCTWIMATACYLAVFWICAILPQGFGAIEILAIMKVPKKIDGDKRIYPKPEEMPLLLHSLQLLENEFDQSITLYILPCTLTFQIIMNIVTNYCAIALPFHVHPAEKIFYTYISIWLTAFNMVVCLVYGNLFKRSSATLRSWRIRPGNTKYLTKVLRSCRPNKVKIGRFYFLRVINALTTVNRVINTTGKLLIWTGFGK